MILNVQETMMNMWNNIKPFMSGITASGIISVVFYALTRASVNKVANKIDYNKLAKDTEEKALDKIGKTTLSMNIEPVVEKSLNNFKEAFYQTQIDLNKQVLKQLHENQKMLIAMADMFEDSVVMTEEKKEAIKKIRENIERQEQEDKQQEVVINVEGLVKEEIKPKAKKENKPNIVR